MLGQVQNIVKEQKGIVVEDRLMDIADSLSKYGIAPRYPNEIEIDEMQAKKAIENAGKILSWVNDVIKAPFVNS